VVGAYDELKGQIPIGLVVLKAGCGRPHNTIAAELSVLVRDQIGPVASFKRVIVVARLPKTRSGKILRGTMRAIADRQPYKTPATIDDPAILDEIRKALGE
jgi:propionyl-CoA synthetase